ncbi:hypothetical protein Drorol1_Dr00025834 [Drosera rotundifolia]
MTDDQENSTVGGGGAYHVPQQSRRDKLRIINTISHHHHNHSHLLCDGPRFDPDPIGSWVKQEGTQGGGFSIRCLMGSNNNMVEDEVQLQHGGHGSLDPTSAGPVNPVVNLLYGQSFRDLGYQVVQNHHGNNSDHSQERYYNALQAATTTTARGLSLTLSSSQNQSHQWNAPVGIPFGIPTGAAGYERSSSCVGDVVATGNSWCSGPLGPFTGYALILKGSRFVAPAVELMDEVCRLGGQADEGRDKLVADSSLMEGINEGLSNAAASVEDSGSNGDCGGGDGRTRSKLIAMLDEVYRRYKRFYQQLETVLTSFETVVGLSNAAPFINLAFKTMSKHFRCLRNAITEQLQSIGKTPSNSSGRKEEILRYDGEKGGFYSNAMLQSTAIVDQQPVWRPQRGLPERAVSVLRAWLFEHFLHPYPTDTDKLMLAKQTGLSRNQVSNWFINARVRLWKPMVEEIYALETRQVQKASRTQRVDEHNSGRCKNNMPSSTSLSCDAPSTSATQDQDPALKRTRKALPELRGESDHQQPMSMQYGQFPNTVHGGNGVSLTLGLRQDNMMASPEPFPVTPIDLAGMWSQRQYG